MCWWYLTISTNNSTCPNFFFSLQNWSKSCAFEYLLFFFILFVTQYLPNRSNDISFGYKTVIQENFPWSCSSFILLQEVMRDPHVAADGFTYEAEAIRGWLDSGHDTSPMTNSTLSHQNLVPNRALRSAIQDWLQSHWSSLLFFLCPFLLNCVYNMSRKELCHYSFFHFISVLFLAV